MLKYASFLAIPLVKPSVWKFDNKPKLMKSVWNDFVYTKNFYFSLHIYYLHKIQKYGSMANSFFRNGLFKII